MRRLIYVPIVHTEIDMGSLNKEIKAQYLKKFGQKKWDEHRQFIADLWQGIGEKIKRLNLDYEKLRIYQDGLPLCGKEEKIIKDLVARKSPNHELVSWLMKKGARIEGTEDPQLLVQEYKMLKTIQTVKIKSQKIKAIRGYEEQGALLLKRRDQFIAQRIAKTLKEGETGVLFIGLMHRVDEALPSDIGISYLIYRLPFKRNFVMKKAYG